MATVFDVANFFIFKNNFEKISTENESINYDQITNIKLKKLVYFAQGLCLAILNKPLFNDILKTWTCGPVSPILYQKFRIYGSDPIKIDIVTEKVHNNFSQVEVNILNFVYKMFSNYPAYNFNYILH